jgi:hypothetical protein
LGSRKSLAACSVDSAAKCTQSLLDLPDRCVLMAPAF